MFLMLLMLWSWSLFRFLRTGPVDVIDKVLQSVVIKLVKVQWSNHSIQEAT